MPKIKLQSSDGKIFEVDRKVAKCSVLIKVILEDLGTFEKEGEAFQVTNVRSDILERVIKWASHHKNDPMSPQNDYFGNYSGILEHSRIEEKRDICDWDAQFLKENQDYLMELMAAANYLDMKNLFDITYEALAKSMKLTHKIRETFNIKKQMRKIGSKFNCVII